jgi:hypothetical protein
VQTNGARLDATNEQVVAFFMGIAAGRLSRDEVEKFFRQRTLFEA